MDYRTMGQMEVKNLPKENKQIYVIQGNLDDERLRQIPPVNGYVLVTGNVFLLQNKTVHSGLIVLGDAEMCRATVEGSMHVYGKCKAQRLIVHGELVTKAGATDIEEKVISLAGHTYI